MALTSSATTHNMSVGETCINGQKQHTVVDNYDPPTVVRNLMGEFHGVTITANKWEAEDEKSSK